MDSNLEFLDAFARSASSSDLLERLLAIGRFLAQYAKSEVARCVGRRDFERGPRWGFWRVRPIPEEVCFRFKWHEARSLRLQMETWP